MCVEYVVPHILLSGSSFKEFTDTRKSPWMNSAKIGCVCGAEIVLCAHKIVLQRRLRVAHACLMLVSERVNWTTVISAIENLPKSGISKKANTVPRMSKPRDDNCSGPTGRTRAAADWFVSPSVLSVFCFFVALFFPGMTGSMVLLTNDVVVVVSSVRLRPKDVGKNGAGGAPKIHEKIFLNIFVDVCQ